MIVSYRIALSGFEFKWGSVKWWKSEEGVKDGEEIRPESTCRRRDCAWGSMLEERRR